ncbi:MAG TPA: ATP-dependent helicase HrpB [Bacteroidota bacterium]|nr:ATP-dependent helicase HrpB [Bacteroidota bacterium]
MNFPIESVLPDLCSTLKAHKSVVLSAEPGAGKTTRVPPALLGESWLAGKKIVLLEPRRLAAQRAASYMAQQLGEKVGGTVGYRIRGDQKIGSQTRLEVVTEGILTRIIQDDPALTDIGLVIFDEFHERSIHADLGLALCLNVQEELRPDLRILVMSATLNGLAISQLLGTAPVIRHEGKPFGVVIRYLEKKDDRPLEDIAASAVARAIRNDEGDVLVFLPGQREIRRVGELLRAADLGRGTNVRMLYGDAPPEDQRAALDPSASGIRKVILSTNIAETSLTIDGVRVVIDSGLVRVSRFDPRKGMAGLVTVPVSKASADQRCGRAGRQASGVCYRLWTEAQHLERLEFSPPEILSADLAPLALELARWGTPNGEGLHFLDPPPEAQLARARGLLTNLEALDEKGTLTAHGRAMADFPVHPRFAHMILRAKEMNLASDACDVAALLEERDIATKESDIDLHHRWEILRGGRIRDSFALSRIRAQAERLRKIVGASPHRESVHRLGVLLALAYPERIAKRRSDEGDRYQLANGVGGILPKKSALSKAQYLAVGEVDGEGREVRIYLAEPIEESDLRSIFASGIRVEDELHWDEREEAVVGGRVERYGELRLRDIRLRPDAESVRKVMIEGIRRMGLSALPWSKGAEAFRERSEWLRMQGVVGASWPNLSDDALLTGIDEWLGLSLEGISKREHLGRLDIHEILRGLFSHRQILELDRMAPTHLVVATGSRVSVEYHPGSAPVLAVRLQEMFGERSTPTVAGGRVRVVLHLLSPARRPLAVTQDLESFWKNAYPEVRKDMRGKYPKHHWPEDPLAATPTKRTKPKVR